MKALVSVAAGGLLLAAGILIACGGGGDATAPPPEAGTPDTSTPIDAGADSPARDSSIPDSAVPRAPFDGSAPLIACAVSPCITKIVAGDKHYCATATDGAIRCWGDPGPLGDFVDGGDPNAGATPVVLTGLSDAVDISVSSQHTCVAHPDGGVACFGANNPTPTPVTEVPAATKLSVSDTRSCAVLTTGDLFCWGNSYQWGMGNVVMPLGAQHAVAAAVAQAGGFAIGSQGTLFSWGSDTTLLGRGTPFMQDLTPAPVTGVPTVLQVATSNGSAVALGSDGRLFGWGHNTNGVLGIGSLQGAPTVTEILFDTQAWPTQVAISVTHSCARLSDGSLSCWGAMNKSGQLGYEALTGVYVPTMVQGLEHAVVAVAVGMFSTCILSDDGSVQCWGDNTSGQLALGTRDQARHVSPTAVVFH
jgi:alpha-tubulin suppressor-like RCC1 family protein